MAESNPSESDVAQPQHGEKEQRRFRAILIFVFIVLTILFLLFFFRGCEEDSGLVMERFDRDAAGWIVKGDAQSASDEPEYEKRGGNPGGCVFAEDDGVGGVWYWSAPEDFRAKFAADVLENRDNPQLRFVYDLKQSNVENPFDNLDIILAGEGLELTFFHNSPPKLDWTSYATPLEAENWKVGRSENPATEEQLAQVLNSLERIWIRGEYRTGNDIGHLDNVGLKLVD
ncbi:MAG: laminin B domain-containing protein [Verrucomicrobiota bacterium]